MQDTPSTAPVEGHQLYQHIMVFGRPGHFITRFDNDVDTEREFRDYDSALLYLVGVVAQSRVDEGRRMH